MFIVSHGVTHCRFAYRTPAFGPGPKVDLHAIFNCVVGVLLANDSGGGGRIHRKLSNLMAVGMFVWVDMFTKQQIQVNSIARNAFHPKPIVFGMLQYDIKQFHKPNQANTVRGHTHKCEQQHNTALHTWPFQMNKTFRSRSHSPLIAFRIVF